MNLTHPSGSFMLWLKQGVTPCEQRSNQSKQNKNLDNFICSTHSWNLNANNSREMQKGLFAGDQEKNRLRKEIFEGLFWDGSWNILPHHLYYGAAVAGNANVSIKKTLVQAFQIKIPSKMSVSCLVNRNSGLIGKTD